MEREIFLNRVASSLARERQTSPPIRTEVGVPDFYKKAPLTTNTRDNASWAETFRLELEAIGGVVSIVDDVDGASCSLRQTLAELGPESIITWAKSEFIDWNLDWLWDTNGAQEWTSEAFGANLSDARIAARSAHVGVTTVDFAIVNTGTLMFVTNPRRNRSVSLLPTVHIALVRESQLVQRMGLALEILNGTDGASMPSSVHFISGPSRSADIENDLCIGVHGPAAVTVIVCKGI